MTVFRRLYANRWARYALTIALLGVVVYKVDVAHLSRAVQSVRPYYLAFGLVLTLPFLYVKALRWYLMLAAAGVSASFGEASLSLVGGMGLALVTPARLGELMRAAYLRDPQKMKIAALVLVDKGFDVLVLACLSVAGAWVLLGPGVGVAFTVLSLVGLVGVYRPGPIARFALRTSNRLPARQKLERTAAGLEALSPAATTGFLALTLLSFMIVLVQFGIILLSWHTWSVSLVVLTFPIVVLTNVLPITIGGLGVREATAAALLAHYGVAPSHAVLAAFLMFAMNTALPGILGAAAMPLVARRSVPAAGALDRP